PLWGKHTLESLPVGQQWRLGNESATCWRTAVPLIQGDVLIAPGAYRVALSRRGEQSFTVDFASAAMAFGGNGTPGFAAKLVPGKHEVEKRLTLELRRTDGKGQNKNAGAAELPALLQIRFGPHRADAEFTVPGARELLASSRFRLIGWSLPSKLVEDRLAAGEGVPIATFVPVGKPRKQDPEVFNVVIRAQGAELIPGLRMPEDSFGFGDVAPPSPAWRQPAEVEWSDLAQPTERLEFAGKPGRKDKLLVLELRCGKRAELGSASCRGRVLVSMLGCVVSE